MKKVMIASLLLSVCGGVWAQPTPAQIQMQQHQQNQNLGGMIQSDNIRRCGNPNGCSGATRAQPRGPSAAEIRAWERRERKVQERIARHKATPYYGAIAFDFGLKDTFFRGGYAEQQKAIKKTLSACRSSNCKLIATFANACAVVAQPVREIRTLEEIFVVTNPDANKAAVLALQNCEARYGRGKCGYWVEKNTEQIEKFCTGYDYSIYGH